MNATSNICLQSNIYNRTDNDVKNDIDFVKNVSGYEALKIIKYELQGTLLNVKLSPVQEMELKNGQTCHRAKSGETTHGKILEHNKVKWVCKCEYNECAYYRSCVSDPMFRRIQRYEIKAEPPVLDNSFTYDSFLDVDIDYDDFILDNEIEENHLEMTDEILEEFCADETVYPSEIPVQATELVKISSPNIIIKSEIDSCIFVNAGPGTGKTYTVINRLLYIIENKLAELSNILVICYSRSAVAEIKNRIAKGLADINSTYEVNKLNICTFDSFATRCLYDTEDISSLSYDARIELFNKNVKSDWFECLEYLIIDELQDLVNERAQMVLNIIKNTWCGLLLLGDRCQAIYDYECGEASSINSAEFYDNIHKLLDDGAKYFELTKNNRQNSKLAAFNADVREALLSLDIKEQNEYVAGKLKAMKKVAFKIDSFKLLSEGSDKIAILCRRNGEAEKISSSFHQKNIPHNMLRGNLCVDKLHRWIADVFWDYREDYIAKTHFVERVLERTNQSEAIAETLYSSVCEITESTRGILSMNDFTSAISKTVLLPKQLLSIPNNTITVSNIHRAKGREFDNVFLLENKRKMKNTCSEEARVNYVAFTRPKKELSLLEAGANWYLKKIDNSRYIGTGRSHKGNIYCSSITIGFDGDVDNLSFVSHKLFSDDYKVIANQRYIAENIKINDSVEIYYEREKNRYVIDHNGRSIGLLSDDIIAVFRKAVNATQNKRDIPPRLTGVYVNNVISVVSTRFNESIPLWFRESRVWLGVELTGFAKVIWS